MKAWQTILIILLTAAICSVIGYGYGRRRTWGSTPVADTVRIRDTIRDSIPYPVIETVVQEVPELFPVYITLDGDTIQAVSYTHLTLPTNSRV